MARTPVQQCGGTIYSARGRTGTARVDLQQPGAPMPCAAPLLSPWSFTKLRSMYWARLAIEENKEDLL